MNEAIEAMPGLGLGYLDRGYTYGLLNHGVVWCVCGYVRKDCRSNNMFWIG